MLFFTADSRDGVPSGAVCNTCCCETLSLLPGETNLIQINYAPWSVPFVSPGIVRGTRFEFDGKFDACDKQDINGFAPPNATGLSRTTAVNTPVVLDYPVDAAVAPAGNTFTYEGLGLEGPNNGDLTVNPSTGAITYTPNTAFVGHDSFYIKTTDAQGREITRAVSVAVGPVTGAQDPRVFANEPFVDLTKVMVNQRMQMLSFPLYLPLTVRECAVWRMTIRQPAQDCECNTYHHYKCFDIRVGQC